MMADRGRRSERRLARVGHSIMAFLGVAMLCARCSGISVQANDALQQPADAPEEGIMWANSPGLHIKRSVNSMVEFYCGITARPGNHDHHRHNRTITWLKDGELLDDKVGKNRISQPGWSLKITRLRSTDSGNYTCIVKSDVYQLQRTFVLKVRYNPRSVPIIEKQPTNQTVPAGSKVIFECSCLNSGLVEMIWAKLHLINGTYGSGPLVHEDPHVSILKNWSFTHSPLVLENVQRADEGWYVCGLRNSIAKIHEAAFLTVVGVCSAVSENKQSVETVNYIIFTSIGLFVFLVIIIIIVVIIFYYKFKKLRMTQYKLYHKNASVHASVVPQSETVLLV